jgi:hypothetical protein
MKTHIVELQLIFAADRQKDGQDGTNSIFSQFWGTRLKMLLAKMVDLL